MVNLLEALMILFFGLSWPLSIRKSWISKTAEGKSLFFEVFIWIGYIFGMTRKILLMGQGGENLDWIFYLGGVFYIINLLAISIDILLYFRNVKLDKQRREMRQGTL